MIVHRHVDGSDDLRHAIQSYERAVERRRARVARRASSSPTPPVPRPRRPELVRPVAAAGLLLVVAIGFVTLRERGTTLHDPDGTPLAPQLQSGVGRVVLDPGHGGRDPGARAAELKEAALVLDVATRLETRLTSETGIEVVLTRRDDVYVTLRDRIELANQVGADLFLSIHANASANHLAGGVATYYRKGSLYRHPPGNAHDNFAGRAEPDDRPPPVGSMATSDNRAGSRDFAELVQRNLVGGIRELHPHARDLGVKQERFEVMIGALMPSVLTEVSFLTNEEEATLLATDAYLDLISDALFLSILEYQSRSTASVEIAANN